MNLNKKGKVNLTSVQEKVEKTSNNKISGLILEDGTHPETSTVKTP